MLSFLRLCWRLLILRHLPTVVAVPKKDGKECNMENTKDCAMNVNDSENPENACAVCGKAADSKGQQVDTKHAGETVHLCCEGCLTAYNQNPDKYSKTEKKKVPVKRNERTTAY